MIIGALTTRKRVSTLVGLELLSTSVLLRISHCDASRIAGVVVPEGEVKKIG
jgi:hypothetical protein